MGRRGGSASRLDRGAHVTLAAAPSLTFLGWARRVADEKFSLLSARANANRNKRRAASGWVEQGLGVRPHLLDRTADVRPRK